MVIKVVGIITVPSRRARLTPRELLQRLQARARQSSPVLRPTGTSAEHRVAAASLNMMFITHLFFPEVLDIDQGECQGPVDAAVLSVLHGRAITCSV